MDEALFARLKAGDPTARTPVRNQVRSLAARVLSAPQWRITDQSARSEMERAAANDALASRAGSAVELTVEAMAQAAASGLRWLRSRDGVRGEHPDPDLMARVALETASAAQAMRLNQHLEECASCKAHMQAGRAALRLAASAQLSVPKPAPAPAPAAPPLSPDLRRKPADSRAKGKAKAKANRRRKPPKKKDSAKLWPALVVVALVAAAVVWKVQPSAEERIWIAASVLPDELPPTGHASDYSGELQDTILGMQDGKCEAAAARLRVESRKAPNDVYLAYYLGLANVCLRNGPEAVNALRKANGITADLPWGYDWWWAQALILEGSTDDALATLDALAGSRHARADDAAALAAELRRVR